MNPFTLPTAFGLSLPTTARLRAFSRPNHSREIRSNAAVKVLSFYELGSLWQIGTSVVPKAVHTCTRLCGRTWPGPSSHSVSPALVHSWRGSQPSDQDQMAQISPFSCFQSWLLVHGQGFLSHGSTFKPFPTWFPRPSLFLPPSPRERWSLQSHQMRQGRCALRCSWTLHRSISHLFSCVPLGHTYSFGYSFKIFERAIPEVDCPSAESLVPTQTSRNPQRKPFRLFCIVTCL